MNLLIPVFSPATGTWGGLTRSIAIAEAARSAGHRVAFCASGYLEASLRQRGYVVYPAPATTMLGLPRPISHLIESHSQRATLPVKPGKSFGSIWLVLLVSGMARAGYLRHLIEAELRATREFEADALFTDLDPGAFACAAITRLPIASAYQSIVESGIGGTPYRLMRRAIAGALKSLGQPVRTPEALAFGPHVLKIVPSIPELDGADPNRPDICYVGHLLGDIQAVQSSAFRPIAGKRYVFVYLGTGSISLDRARAVLPHAFPAGSNWSVLVGAQSIQSTERIGDVEFRSYVPADAVLPHCDWTICHGGQNTIIQSLRHAVPLLIFPGPIFERRFNAEHVQRCGAAIMGELGNFDAKWLRQAVIKQAQYADVASHLRARIDRYGGAAAAVQAIERHIALHRSQ